MAEALHKARCLLHPGREAAGLCTRCGDCFCRECVTEHEGRLRCARCLEADSQATVAATGGWRATATAALRLAVGLVACWLFFLAVGELLMALPRFDAEGGEAASEVAE